ncbi:MAG: AMP-binding protein, partial [Acidobacteriota bacterium]
SLLPAPLPVLATGAVAEGWSSWDEVIAQQPAEEIPLPLVERSLDETLSIMYTSGTTGDPKGVVLTRRALYQSVVAALERIEVRPADHVLSVLPLYHALALMANFLMPLYMGGKVTFLATLEAQKILKAFREEGISIFVAVPQFFYLVHQRILQQVDQQSLWKRILFWRLLAVSGFCNRRLRFNPGRLFFGAVHKTFGERLRYFAVGGARFDRGVAQSFRDLGFTVIQAYGMTESAAVATAMSLDSRAIGSVGPALPHARIRIHEPDDQGVGEVLIGGDSLLSGYWKNPQATQEILQDGWLHSGDLGYLSRAGDLYITGRQKDVIVLSSGKNIFPEELEHHYQTNGLYIKELCVVGVPDDSEHEGQEKLYAVVVPDFDALRSEQIVNAADMIRYYMENASQKLPAYKRVKSFEIRRDPLPRTTTRKVKRYEVLQELSKERDSEAPPPRFSEASQPRSKAEERIFELIRQARQVPLIHREMNLELDVGFDSLQRVEFLSNLQDAFGIELSDDEATEIYTVQDLVQAVESRLSGPVAGGAAQRRSWQEILEQPLKQEDRARQQEFLTPRPLSELFVYFLCRCVYLLSKIFFRLRVTGRQNLPRDYPYLICPNHLSYIDSPIFASSLPYRVIKRLFFLGYSDYFKGGGFLAWIGRLTKTVPVDPDRNLRQALRLGAEGLRRNLVLCVFPEGERSIDGTLKKFRQGPAILAQTLQVPVVPAAITGTYQVWARGSGKIRLHPVRVRLGKPLTPPLDSSQIEEFNQQLFDAVAELIRQEEEAG